MNEIELKKENTALRKQNKNLKRLLEEALTIIRKMKDFIDAQTDDPARAGAASAKPGKKTVPIKNRAKKAAKPRTSKRKQP